LNYFSEIVAAPERFLAAIFIYIKSIKTEIFSAFIFVSLCDGVYAVTDTDGIVR